MRASQLRFLLWRFIALSDTGIYDSLTVEEVSRHAQARMLSSFILEHFGEASGVGTLDETDRAALDSEGGGMANGPDSPRKFGVSKRGLQLLMAYALQSIQDRRVPEGE
jgi:hypothetical protein